MSISSTPALENQEQINLSNNVESIEQFLRFIWRPGCVYELRCLNTSKGIVSGYFNDPALMATAAHHWSGRASGVYFTLNPVACKASNNADKAKETAKDADILKRFLLPIDCDAIRQPDTSSTSEEHDLAIAKAQEIAAWLGDRGFPVPICADSGNGGHLLYAIDLPNDDESKNILQAFLKSLSSKVSDARVKVDTSIHNASRIFKLYGTLAMKGEPTEERPHRYAKVLSLPERLEIVPKELIAEIAREYLESSKPRTTKNEDQAQEDKGLPYDRWDKRQRTAFNKKLQRCATSPGKNRSKDCFALCCWCIKQGLRKAAVWEHCQQVGKWAEGKDPQKYFDRTWGKALKKVCEEEQNDGEQKDISALLLDIGKECELWHSPDRKGYATTLEGDSFLIASSGFEQWLRKGLYSLTQSSVHSATIDNAIQTLQAIALFDGKEHNTYLRFARLGKRLVINLANEDRQCVIVEPGKWRIDKAPPDVRFIKRDNAKAMPLPQRGGKIDLLQTFINVRSDRFPLFVGCLLDGMKGFGPYHVASLNAEQGSGKSLMMRKARHFLDPVHRGELSDRPKEPQDLFIEATHNHGVYLDNLSRIPQGISDALCRLSTGGGLKQRQLYTNGEEFVLDACCPVWLNAIEEVITSSDLADRAVCIHAEIIKDRKRETVINEAFAKVYPLVFGALLDGIAYGMQNPVELEDLPRMADSANWIASCFPGLGWKYEDWEKPYKESQEDMAEIALMNSLPATTLIRWFNDRGRTEWTGPPLALRNELVNNLEWEKQKYLPANAASLCNALRRVAPDLRRNEGIDFFRLENEDGTVKKIRLEGKTVRAYTVRSVAVLPNGNQNGNNNGNTQNTANNQADCTSVADVAVLFSPFAQEEKESKRMNENNTTHRDKNMENKTATTATLVENADKNRAFCEDNTLPICKADRQRVIKTATGKPHEIPAMLAWGIVVCPVEDKPGQWQVIRQGGIRTERRTKTGPYYHALIWGHEWVAELDAIDKERKPWERWKGKVEHD